MSDPLPPIFGWQGKSIPAKMSVPLGTVRGVGLAFPGAAYTQERPLLVAVREVLVAAGFEVVLSERYYGMDPELSKLTGEDREACISTDAGAFGRVVFDRSLARPVILAGKSLGTTSLAHAMTQVPDLAAFPSIWLTPLWKDEAIFKVIAAAGPKAFVLIGKADPQWDQAIADKLIKKKVDIMGVEGADHGMTVAGSAAATAQVLMDLRVKLAALVATVLPPVPLPVSNVPVSPPVVPDTPAHDPLFDE